MKTLPLRLPDDLSPPVALALFETLQGLTDALWEQYGPELVELMMAEEDPYPANQLLFDFDDDLPF